MHHQQKPTDNFSLPHWIKESSRLEKTSEIIKSNILYPIKKFKNLLLVSAEHDLLLLLLWRGIANLLSDFKKNNPLHKTDIQ